MHLLSKMLSINVGLHLPETPTEPICVQRLHGASGGEAVEVLDSQPVETTLASTTLGFRCIDSVCSVTALTGVSV